MGYLAKMFIVGLDVFLDSLELEFELVLYEGSQQNLLFFFVSGETFGVSEHLVGGG